jgi:RNA polymerase sigma factor (sigma-70 family)
MAEKERKDGEPKNNPVPENYIPKPSVEQVLIDGETKDLWTAGQDLLDRCYQAVRTVIRAKSDLLADLTQDLAFKILESQRDNPDQAKHFQEEKYLQAAARNMVNDYYRRANKRSRASNPKLASNLWAPIQWDGEAFEFVDRRNDPSEIVQGQLDAESFIDLVSRYLTKKDLDVFRFDPRREMTATVVAKWFGMTEQAVRQSRTRTSKVAREVWLRREVNQQSRGMDFTPPPPPYPPKPWWLILIFSLVYLLLAILFCRRSGNDSAPAFFVVGYLLIIGVWISGRFLRRNYCKSEK